MFSVLNFLFPSILFSFIPVIALKVVFPNNSFFLLQNSRRDNNRFCRSNLRPRRNFESSPKCPHNCEPWEYCREENTPAPKIYLPLIHGPEPHITHPNTTFIYREEYGYPRNHPLHQSVSWFHFISQFPIHRSDLFFELTNIHNLLELYSICRNIQYVLRFWMEYILECSITFGCMKICLLFSSRIFLHNVFL